MRLFARWRSIWGFESRARRLAVIAACLKATSLLSRRSTTLLPFTATTTALPLPRPRYFTRRRGLLGATGNVPHDLGVLRGIREGIAECDAFYAWRLAGITCHASLLAKFTLAIVALFSFLATCRALGFRAFRPFGSVFAFLPFRALSALRGRRSFLRARRALRCLFTRRPATLFARIAEALT
jgi:hypothetical protein